MRLSLFAAAALGAVTGCGPRLLVAPEAPTAVKTLAATALTPAVILVSIDGLRPDAIDMFDPPTIARLVREGRSTLLARSIALSNTLPSHTSMVTGAGTDVHHVTWNSAILPRRKLAVPSIFSEARSRGYTTAAFFSKAKFAHWQRPGTLDYSQAPSGMFGYWSAAKTATNVETYLSSHKPALLFVHLPDPDRAGHQTGWMGGRYGEAVLRADEALTRVLAAADRTYGDGQYTVIITADHGGHGLGHGTTDPRDTTIPWIAWGCGVDAGTGIDRPVTTLDTAPTVLRLLGIAPPADWTGQAIILNAAGGRTSESGR